MRAWPWIVGGGALAYAFARGRAKRSPKSGAPGLVAPLPGRWVWPVPRWNGRPPVISDGFGSPRLGGMVHGGVDLMFARVASDPFKAGTPNGAAHHVMPDGLVAVAASDGVVWSAMQTPRGFAVVVDHTPTKATTFYTHLEKLFVKGGERVRAGQPLGIIGADPLDAAHLKHLHFEIWLGGPQGRIDPAPVMRHWQTVADPNALVARNASRSYRSVGAAGEPYPDWVRELDGKAGVYLIRDIATHELLYVGSSAGALYSTLTRHFQTVRHEAQEDPMT